MSAPTVEQTTALEQRFNDSCKAIGNGIDRLQKANASSIAALEECRDYFDERADAECDPSSPGYTGNEEMRLLVIVEDALGRARTA